MHEDLATMQLYLDVDEVRREQRGWKSVEVVKASSVDDEVTFTAPLGTYRVGDRILVTMGRRNRETG